MNTSATTSLVAIQTAHFIPVSSRNTPRLKHPSTNMPNNHKTYSTFDEKQNVSSDEASIRSASTMSSLKKLLPNKEKAMKDKDKSSQANVIRNEARATYLAYR